MLYILNIRWHFSVITLTVVWSRQLILRYSEWFILYLKKYILPVYSISRYNGLCSNYFSDNNLFIYCYKPSKSAKFCHLSLITTNCKIESAMKISLINIPPLCIILFSLFVFAKICENSWKRFSDYKLCITLQYSHIVVQKALFFYFILCAFRNPI